MTKELKEKFLQEVDSADVIKINDRIANNVVKEMIGNKFMIQSSLMLDSGKRVSYKTLFENVLDDESLFKQGENGSYIVDDDVYEFYDLVKRM